MKPNHLLHGTCAVLLSLLGSCVEPLPPGPALGGWQPPPRPNDNNPPAGPSRESIRNQGYYDGRSDATRGLTAEALRHGSGYKQRGLEAQWRAYSDGYADGYGEGRRAAGNDNRGGNVGGNAGGNVGGDRGGGGGNNQANTVREAYLQGYSKGRTDARNERSFNENRYQYGGGVLVLVEVRNAFVQGYRDGYHGTALRY